MISTYGTQDKGNETTDSVYISIYSDFYKRVINCGMYEMDSSRYLILNDLEVPCNDDLVVTISERDNNTFDTATLRVNCSNTGAGTLQF